MGRSRSGGSLFHHMAERLQKEKADKARYADNKIESDRAKVAVGRGLGARASFVNPINLDEFAQEKREQARSKRSARREERRVKRDEREDRYKRRLEERRRENEMRKPQQEIGGEIGVLGAPNPYGDDAIWDNNKRSWAPNPKKDTVDEWNKYRDKSQSTAPERETNLFGQSKGTNIRSDAPVETMKSGAELNDNRDFKKLYEELLKIKGGKIT